METSSHTYIAMDLKSFYASVECVDRGFGSTEHQSGGSGCLPDAEDHLPGSVTLPESLWDFRKSKTV